MPVIINPGIPSGSWTVSLARALLLLGPPCSNRGLLVKHDVPVGKIRAAAVAWECALGLYTKNAVTLHQSCVMDKLDWRVRVRERERTHTYVRHTSADACSYAL